MLIALFIGGVLYLVWYSPAFVIQAVDVNGGELASGFDFDSAIGENLLFYRSDFNLETAPQAASIDIGRKYFSRRLEITLTARERYAMWCDEVQVLCFWIDPNGVAFAEAPDIKGPLILRLVRDESGRDLKLGDQVLEDELLVNLRAAFTLLDDLDVPVETFKIENLKFREAIAYTTGPTLYFSLQDDPSFGRSVVEQLRNSGEWNAVRYLDLRVPGRAYYSN